MYHNLMFFTKNLQYFLFCSAHFSVGETFVYLTLKYNEIHKRIKVEPATAVTGLKICADCWSIHQSAALSFHKTLKRYQNFIECLQINCSFLPYYRNMQKTQCRKYYLSFYFLFLTINSTAGRLYIVRTKGILLLNLQCALLLSNIKTKVLVNSTSNLFPPCF